MLPMVAIIDISVPVVSKRSACLLRANASVPHACADHCDVPRNCHESMMFFAIISVNDRTSLRMRMPPPLPADSPAAVFAELHVMIEMSGIRFAIQAGAIERCRRRIFALFWCRRLSRHRPRLRGRRRSAYHDLLNASTGAGERCACCTFAGYRPPKAATRFRCRERGAFSRS